MIRGASWLSEVSATRQVLSRIAFVCSLLAGVNLKGLIRFTPECKPTIAALETLLRAKAGPRLMGASLLIFRQAFTKKAIEAAKKIVLRCARGKRNLGYRDLESIKTAWEQITKKYGKKHAKKVVSRSKAFTGITWINALIQKWDRRQFNKAADVLGELLLVKKPTSSFADATTIVAKLPLLGIHYGSKHVVRCAYVFRGLISKGPMLSITNEDWQANRDMNPTTTSKGFDALSVEDIDDAHRMRFTIAEIMAAHHASSSTKAMWRNLQTIEMPCSTCEWNACLNQIQQQQGCNEYAAIKFVLKRLPGKTTALMRMRKRLLGQVWKDEDVYTGLDVARCSAVFQKYLSAEPVISGNAWEQWMERREEFINSFGAPVLYCTYCGSELAARRGGGNVSQSACARGTACANARHSVRPSN